MSKKVEMQVTADITPAQRELDALRKAAKGIKADVGVNDVGVGDEASNQKSEQEIKNLNNVSHKLADQLKKLIDYLEKKQPSSSSSDSSSSSNTGSSNSTGSDVSEPAPPEKKLTKEEKEKLRELQKLQREAEMKAKSTAFAAVGAAYTGFNMLVKNSREAANYESQSMRIYNRLGEGNNFNKFRTDAYSIGKNYAFSNSESLQTQRELLSGGYKDKASLASDTESVMGTSLAYGLDSSELTGGFNYLAKRGFYGQGEAQSYLNVAGNSIQANQMKGRESEQIRALNAINETLTDGRIEVTSEDFSYIANLQAQLSNLAPELKGEQGVGFLNKMDSMFNSSDEAMLRMVGYGRELGYGVEGLMEAKKRLEQGLSNPETLEAMKRNAPALGLSDPNMMALFINSRSGLSVEESEKAVELIKTNDPRGARLLEQENLEGRRNLQNARSSKAFTQDKYYNEKENAGLFLGNTANVATSGAKENYNVLPTPVKGGLQLFMGVAGGAIKAHIGASLAQSLLGKGSVLAAGAETATGVAGAAGESVATGALGKSLLGGAVKASPGFAGATGLIGKGLEFAGNNSKLFGNVAGGLGLAFSGIKAFKSYREGDNQSAAGFVGEGVGALGGAKAGAALGTMIMPGVGTFIGAVAGGVGGGLLGKGIGRSLVKNPEEALYESSANGLPMVGTKEVTKKEEELLTRKEIIQKKEEQLVDQLLGMQTDSSTSQDGFKAMVNKQETGWEKSQYGQQRDTFAQQYAMGMNPTLDDGSYTGSMSGNNNEQKLWSYFKSRGYSDAAVAGILGNLKQESNLDPTLKQNGGRGPGRGLAQWEIGSDRWNNLNSYAQSKGTDWTDLMTQAEFMEKEMSSKATYWHKTDAKTHENFKNMNDPVQAMYAFQLAYERAGKPMYQNRTKYAQQAYANNKGKSYAIGIDRVSEDQVANIHKDETILNKFDAKKYREKKNEDIFKNYAEISKSNSYSTNNQNSFTFNISVDGQEDFASKVQSEVLRAYKSIKAQLEAEQQSINLNRSYVRVPR